MQSLFDEMFSFRREFIREADVKSKDEVSFMWRVI